MSIMASDAGAFKAATGLFASLDGAWHEVPLGPPATPITIVGHTIGYDSGGSPNQIVLPSGLEDGDLLFLVFGSSSTTAAGPVGWTPLQKDTGNYISGYAYMVAATAAMSGTTIDVPSTTGVYSVVAIRGAEATPHAVTLLRASTTGTTITVTAAHAADGLVLGWGFARASAGLYTSTWGTETIDSYHIADITGTAKADRPAADGSTTATWTGPSSTGRIGVLISLRSAAP